MEKQKAAQDGSTEQADPMHLIDHIKKSITAPSPSTATHAGLLADIHRLQLAVETPLETIYRIGHQSWQNACVRIAIDLGIFDALVKKEGDAVSVQELASTCGADAVFLVRIMRVIVALGLCAESGVEEYKGNAKTEIMTIPQGISSFKAWFDIFTPAATRLPQHMRSQHYQNPTQSTNSAFASATGSEFWDHLKQTPEHAEIFNNFMATRRQGKPNWYDIYPIEQELSSQKIDGEDNILFVDVGGNRGHDLVNLKVKYPRLAGKMILQDLPSVVAHASFPANSNITAMPHDFFSPQPIKHALIYHFRAIFHDWPDASCRQILAHTAAAMKLDHSKLLITEFVLADTGTALFPATLDVQMMGLHAGMERSEKQWRALLEEAGLEVVRIWGEGKGRGGEAVVEARLRG